MPQQESPFACDMSAIAPEQWDQHLSNLNKIFQAVEKINGPHQLPVPVERFREFLLDTQRIGKGVIVGQPGWDTLLENNKQAFTLEFVQHLKHRQTAWVSTSLAKP